MKKIVISVFFCSVFTQFLSAQSWVDLMRDPSINFYDVQKSFEEYWKDTSHIVYVEKYIEGTNQIVLSKKMPGWKTFKRWENRMEPRLFPSGDRSVMENAIKDYYANCYNQQRDAPVNPITQSANWAYVGPSTVPTNGGGAGRVNFIKFAPSDSNIIYLGSPSGGLWKTTNGGISWSTNTDSLPVLGCTDLAIDPVNNQIMYLTTGDGDANDTYSVGILKSTDGGATWNTTGLNWVITSTSLKAIRRVIINPQNPNTLFTATSEGIYRTLNAGATWSLVASTINMYDIEFKPTDTTIVYACSNSRFYKSTNGGTSFTNITSGTPSFSAVTRLSIAVSPANINYVYLLASGYNYGFYGIYRSTNSGTSFTTQATTPNLLGWSSTGSDFGGQGWYDLSLAVSEIDANQVLVGGINIWASADGGSSWTNKSSWSSSSSANYVHGDIHALLFIPGSTSSYFAGSDGGLFKTINDGSNWSDISNGLQIGQIYKIGNSKSNPNLFLTGWQDNGSNRYNGSSWTRILEADGMECIIDWSNNNTQYAELYYGEIYKTTTAGTMVNTIVGSGGTGVNENGNWVTPYIQSPTSASTLFVGKSQVYRSTNAGSNWSQVGSVSGGTGKVIALAVAPSSNSYIYAAKADKIYACYDGISFIDVTGSLPAAGAVAITYIAVHPTDPTKLWVTFSGYSNGNKVYYSIDSGVTWTNYSTGLPNMPINCILNDKNSLNEALYVGTDVGVYYRDNTSSSWVTYNTGLPNVNVNELEIQYSGQKLRAATFGRGVWQSDLYSAPTGIEQSGVSENDITIFPNPNKGNFTVSFDAIEKSNYSIEFYNLMGEQILKEKISNFQGQYSKQFNINEYGKGLYFINVLNDKKQVVKKIIVR